MCQASQQPPGLAEDEKEEAGYNISARVLAISLRAGARLILPVDHLSCTYTC